MLTGEAPRSHVVPCESLHGCQARTSSSILTTVLRDNGPVPVLLALLLLAVTGCSSDSARPPSEVTGLITTIGRGVDGGIESFTVRDGPRSFKIRIDRRRNYGFALQHLEEHRTDRWPVRVRLEQRERELYAVEILDASSPGGVPP